MKEEKFPVKNSLLNQENHARRKKLLGVEERKSGWKYISRPANTRDGNFPVTMNILLGCYATPVINYLKERVQNSVTSNLFFIETLQVICFYRNTTSRLRQDIMEPPQLEGAGEMT